MMRRTLIALFLATLFAAAPPAGAESKDGWPTTPAGTMARGWVDAFSTSEVAMKEFNARNLAPKSLEKKGMEERVVAYRKLKEKYGKLMLGSVVKSEPNELTVKLIASDASSASWVFTVQKEAPYKLISVGMLEQRSHFGGFHH